MEFKGTKGNWYNESNKSISVFHPLNIGERICTIILSGYEPTQEDFANAKLISKSPELLEALKQALSLLEEANLPDEMMETQANFCANTFNLIQEATTL